MRVTYNACGPFTKNKERIQKFKEAGDSRYIYQKELNKACFQFESLLHWFTIFLMKSLLVVLLK